MKNYLKYLTGLCSLLWLLSCTDKLETASIILNASEIEIPCDGGETTVGVKSNRNWTAATTVDWISLSPSSAEAFEASSYMIITVQPNNDISRSGEIIVTADSGEASAKLTVIQDEDRLVIKTAEQMLACMNALASGESADNYRLGKDIDLEGVNLPEVETLQTIFDGQGHSLCNLKLGNSLFRTITATGSVKNLVIDESCELSMAGDIENFGFVAQTSAGNIENVVNNADIVITSLAKGYKGSICGVSTGTVSNCINQGKITYSGAPHDDGSVYIGGVLGRMNAADIAVSRSRNEGDIEIIFSGELQQSIYVGGVCGAVNNNSKALACTNSGDVTVKCKGSNSNAHAAGIVAYAGGEVADCSNSGNILFRSETAEGLADAGVKGTGVAGIASYLGWAGNKVKNNTNTGNVTMAAGFTTGYQTVGSATKFSSNVAGVFAHIYKCDIENCHNTGVVTSVFGCIENCPSSGYNTTARQSIGGVVSSGWGIIANCSNKGKIVADWRTTAHSESLAKNFVTQAGGIVGGDYHSDQLSTIVRDCVNEGDLEIVCDASGSNNAFGGISGWPTKENASGKSVENCVNRGNIIVDGFGKSRVGGIIGGAANLSGNINYGNVLLKGGLNSCAVGGVAGFMNFLNIDGCENYGKVASEVLLNGSQSSAAGAIGGLVGAVGNTEMSYSGCKVDCEVSAVSGSTATMVVGGIGHDKSGGKAFAVGTQESPIKIKGTFNGSVLSESNYLDYIVAGNYAGANSSVTFAVEYLQ